VYDLLKAAKNKNVFNKSGFSTLNTDIPGDDDYINDSKKKLPQHHPQSSSRSPSFYLGFRSFVRVQIDLLILSVNALLELFIHHHHHLLHHHHLKSSSEVIIRNYHLRKNIVNIINIII
jgi:hypothetical protein